MTPPDQWVDAYGDLLYRYALSRLHDEEAAKDAVQETLLAALGSRERFRGDASEKTWFIGILKHKIMDALRQQVQYEKHRIPTWEQESSAWFDDRGRFRHAPRHWEDHPEEALRQMEFWQVFEACLGKLPRRLPAVFSLYEMEGRRSEEICKQLNISTTNLWVMLHRARMGLRACLENHWFHPPNPAEERGA